MTTASAEDRIDVDRLIESICKKLQANRGVLSRSKGFGKLTWRLKKEGFDIRLQPDL